MFVLPLPHYVTRLTKFAYRLRMRFLATGIDLAHHTAVEVTMVVPLMNITVAVGPLLEAIVHDATITATAPRPDVVTSTILLETAIVPHRVVEYVALPSMITHLLEAIAGTRMPHRLPAVNMTPTPTVVTITPRDLEPHRERMAADMRSVHVTGSNSLPFWQWHIA